MLTTLARHVARVPGRTGALASRIAVATDERPSTTDRSTDTDDRDRSRDDRSRNDRHQSVGCGRDRPTSTVARGQSEVLGVALLLGLVVVASTTLLVAGFATLGEDVDRVADSQAERAMAQFDSRASRVALGEASVQRVDMGRPDAEGSLTTQPDAGRVQIEVVDAETGQTEAEVVNRSLGAVVYSEGETTVAYQGGGVWRSDGDGTVMLSRPEFHYENETLSFPIVVVEGNESVDDRLEVAAAGSDRKFPDRSANLTNRVEDVMVRITITSDYYEAWASYFRESTAGVVTVDHDAESVTVTFLGVPTAAEGHGGIVATGQSGRVKLGGTGVYIDSYNSSNGTYQETQNSEGEVTAVGDINSTGDATVEGDLRSGQVVDLSGNTEINNGTVYWTDGYEQDGASVSGGNEQIDGVATILPINQYVRDTVEEARLHNDNDRTAVIQNEAIDSGGTLTAGTYYVDNLVVDPGETLTLDTTDGDITIAVDGYVDVSGKGQGPSKAATVEVVGNGTVRVVVAGTETVSTRTLDANFYLGKNAEVAVPAERASQFRVFGTDSFVAVVASDNSPAEPRFEGVLYAPGGLHGDSEIFVQQASVYGGLVATDVTIKQNADIHYDRALEDATFPQSPTPRLSYLHVSVHTIEVRPG